MAARIGDRGRAACPLYPSGRVLIRNAPMAARAEAGPIEEGAEIIVVGGDRFCLFVRQFDPSQFFIAAPCAFAALVAGMIWWGPFTAVLSCFVVGVTVTLMSLAIEAMRHPIRE